MKVLLILPFLLFSCGDIKNALEAGNDKGSGQFFIGGAPQAERSLTSSEIKVVASICQAFSDKRSFFDGVDRRDNQGFKFQVFVRNCGAASAGLPFEIQTYLVENRNGLTFQSGSTLVTPYMETDKQGIMEEVCEEYSNNKVLKNTYGPYQYRFLTSGNQYIVEEMKIRNNRQSYMTQLYIQAQGSTNQGLGVVQKRVESGFCLNSDLTKSSEQNLIR